MGDEFRGFLDGVSARGGYCLSCLSDMYFASALRVAGYLNEMGISSRPGTCANCHQHRETFRSDRSSGESGVLPLEPSRNFPCTHCGAQCPVPVRLIEQYAGRPVTRWCDTCGKLFDVLMPPKEGASR